MNITTLDVETTTHNKGHPFDPRNKLISYAYKHENSAVNFSYFSDPNFNQPIFIECVVGFNFKFDYHWISRCLPDGIAVWDCQLAEHVYTGQRAPYVSLNECLEKYGLATKTDIVKELWEAGVQTDEIPVPILKEYNEWDVTQEEALYHVQQQLLSEKQKALVLLMGEDLKVLAHVEQSGALFDRTAAEEFHAACVRDVADVEKTLAEKLPRILHGNFNWDSGDHLSVFLYGGTLDFPYATSEEAVYKSGTKKGQAYIKNSWHIERITFPKRFTPLEGTETKKTKDKATVETRLYQTDAPTLQSLKGNKESKAILGLLQSRSEKQKVVEMLESLFKQFTDKQWEHNLVHGQYNQNVAITGRLSSSNPNMQNMPPEIDQFFVSRYD